MCLGDLLFIIWEITRTGSYQWDIWNFFASMQCGSDKAALNSCKIL
jgi:hypothetical protein